MKAFPNMELAVTVLATLITYSLNKENRQAMSNTTPYVSTPSNKRHSQVTTNILPRAAE